MFVNKHLPHIDLFRDIKNLAIEINGASQIITKPVLKEEKIGFT